ncbi:MAG: DUF58 domain-containing protein, partial [Microcella sp.]|nr:DUF58 domain-containing protein [Microcella sp.]
MPRLTARGIAFLVVGVAIGVVAYLIERPELLTVAVIAVAAPIIALIAVATSRPRVRVTRQLDPVVAVDGETVRVNVTVNGRARAAEWVERVPMQPGFAGPGRLREVRLTRPATFGYRYAPGRRGLVSVGPLLIENRDPFALAVRVSDTIATTSQLVIPAVMPLPVGPVPEPSTEAGPRTTRSRERSDDDVVTREYRDGDALRRVHWRVTARQGELMVRQDEPQAGPHSRLIVDTQAPSYSDARSVRAAGARQLESVEFEWIVRMAASAAAHLAERGYSVELTTPTAPELADDEVAPVADGPVGHVLGGLAIMTLGPGSADLGAELPSLLRSGSLPIVALSGAPDAETTRWMLAQRASAAPAVALLVGPAAPVVRDDGS